MFLQWTPRDNEINGKLLEFCIMCPMFRSFLRWLSSEGQCRKKNEMILEKRLQKVRNHMFLFNFLFILFYIYKLSNVKKMILFLKNEIFVY